MTLAGLYARAPIPLQDAMSTAYGVREVHRRYTGRFKRNVLELKAREWWSPEQLVEDQAARLRALVTYCAARIPHYRDEFARLGIGPADIRSVEDLAVLPLLDKETVRAHRDRFLPDERRPKLVAQATGGSTGTPMQYFVTLDAMRFNYAVYEARSRHWAGVRFGDRLASLQGALIIPEGQRSGPLWRHNYAFNQLYLSVYHLSEANLPRYIAALDDFEPVVVASYPSVLHRIARHLLERGDIGRINPRSIISTSETLLPHVRHDIELAFGCRVFNGYSLGELVVYASECPHGDLHLSPEFGVTELIDHEGGHEIVATGLCNLGMPLLRYRTGDLAELAAPGTARCGRGLPCLAELRGRVDDVVRTPDGGVVGPSIIAVPFQRATNLRRAQVRQDSLDRVLVLLETTPDWGPDDARYLEAQLRRVLGPDLVIDCERVDTLPRTSGGKERVIVSSLGSAGGPTP